MTGDLPGKQHLVDIPPWLNAAVDQRIAHMMEALGGSLPPGYLFVLLMLTEPAADASEQEKNEWERRCDNCGTVVPVGVDLMMGRLERLTDTGQIICLTYAACQECIGLEE